VVSAADVNQGVLYVTCQLKLCIYGVKAALMEVILIILEHGSKLILSVQLVAAIIALISL